MDIESFQNIKLQNLGFEEETRHSEPAQKAAIHRAVENIPLPDEMPMAFNYSHLPKDVLKSSSVESLISQNEDLSTRLKVALRRLAIFENENQKLSDDAQRARLSQTAVADQVLIYKEKDGLWKSKLQQAEKQKEVQTEKATALAVRVQKLEMEVERYHKYHDRIKTQVKPYIHQLKEYSRGLEEKNQQLSRENSRTDAQLSDLRFQITEVTKASRMQIELHEKKSQELIHFYEQQIENQVSEITHLNSINQELEIKAIRLNKALEKQDELENQVVEIMRSKEEIKARLEQEVLRLQDKTSELSRSNKRLEIEHADLQELALSNEIQIKTLQKEKQDLNEQLDSLRYMWNAKVEETEKLKSAIQSLERLNVDLSQKVNELRTQQQES
jgi:chromosome segregation ATPase